VPLYAIHTYDDGTIAVSAETDYNSCTPGYLCLWKNAEYSGKDLYQFHDRGKWQNLNSYGASDEVSSWRNRTSYDAQLSWDVGGGGERLCLPHGASAQHLGRWNDEASAVRLLNTSSGC
jgi:hypothetical protein